MPKMKAAVVHAFGKPLAIEEVPVPEVPRNRVLMKVAACGVCHTDLHAARRDFALPFFDMARRLLHGGRGMIERSVSKAALALPLSLFVLCGCNELVPLDTESLIAPRLQRSEVVGFLAGFGTTFAAIPDLIAMFKRRSSAGMNPRMAAIMCSFQLLWIYYGLLIASRPVIVWNVIAVAINFLTVAAYCHYARKERIARARLDLAAAPPARSEHS